MSTTEIVKAFFFDGTDMPAGGDVRIDVLDSLTNPVGTGVVMDSACFPGGWIFAKS